MDSLKKTALLLSSGGHVGTITNQMAAINSINSGLKQKSSINDGYSLS